ncbi:MAG: hypothetical protein WCN92_13180, partial [Eubacteriales bacterium]
FGNGVPTGMAIICKVRSPILKVHQRAPTVFIAVAVGATMLITAAPRIATASPPVTAADVWDFGWWLSHSLGVANQAIPFERYELTKAWEEPPNIEPTNNKHTAFVY